MRTKGADEGDTDEDLFGTSMDEEDERRGTKEADGWITETLEELTQEALSNLLIESESGLLPEPLVVPADPPQTSWLESWEHDPSSRGDPGDCYQAELASTSSDCDAGEDRCDATSLTGYGATPADTGDAEKTKEEEEVKTGPMEQRGDESDKTQEITDEQTRSSRHEVLQSPPVGSMASLPEPDTKVRLTAALLSSTQMLLPKIRRGTNPHSKKAHGKNHVMHEKPGACGANTTTGKRPTIPHKRTHQIRPKQTNLR